jgi:predicted lipoprotein with Yx(FWY)xxD motif
MSARRFVIAASFSTLILAAACSNSSSGGSGGSSASSPAALPAAASAPASAGSSAATGGVTLAKASSSKGEIVTIGGLAVYTYDPDTATTSACSGECAAQWPPVPGTATAGTGLDASKLSTIMRSDGTSQAAYNGHPIYTFVGDKAPGQVTGDGLDGTWHVLLATGAPAAAAAPASSPASAPASSKSSSKAGGSGGYNY